LDIKTLDLRNILVEYQDSSAAMDTRFDIQKLTADIKEIDLNKETVRLGTVALANTDSQILMGKMATINTTTPAADTLSNSSSMNWLVSADKIRVDKTNIWFKDDNQPRMKGFDYFNIKISDFLAELDDLYFSSDSISGRSEEHTSELQSRENL